MDSDTDGAWVRDELRRLLSRLGPAESNAIIVVDAVRIPDQIRKIREAYGYLVVHVHLSAPDEVLSERYTKRTSGLKEFSNFAATRRSKTEARIQSLEEMADVVLDTNLNLADDVFVRAASRLGFYTRFYDRTVDVLVGGQYGSEGKGHIASFLAREYDGLVRVGGPNAGHKVYLKPAPYTHHQLPSGTLRNPLASLIIASGAVLNSELLIREISECKVDASRLFIDPQAMIISPRDIKAEVGLTERISSTGQGVGIATARRITDRGKRIRLAKDVPELKPFTQRACWEVLERLYRDGKRILVEGTQGTGLSLYHGAYVPLRGRRLVAAVFQPWRSALSGSRTVRLISTGAAISIGQLCDLRVFRRNPVSCCSWSYFRSLEPERGSVLQTERDGGTRCLAYRRSLQ